MSDAPKRFFVQLFDDSKPPDGVHWASHFDSADDAMRASNAALGSHRVESDRESIRQQITDTETSDRWVRTGTAEWEAITATP